MGIGSTLAGMEVPIIGSDSVKWVEVSVPSSSSSAVSASPPFAPLTEDYASSYVVKDSPSHLIWYSLFRSVCVVFVASQIAFSLPQNIHWTISTNSSCNCDRKIHKALPHALELLELSANKEFPMMGLRITFPDALSPFAFVCQNQVNLPATIHAKSLFLNTPFGFLVFSLKVIFSSVYPKK